MSLTKFLFLVFSIFCLACHENDQIDSVSFGVPKLVTVLDYNGHIMEPFISRDGTMLFFNNSNAPTENTNLHWCTTINDTLFQYQGELNNINTNSLEGVPSMDTNGRFFFIYTGSYNETLSTIYQGQFSSGAIIDINLVENISQKTAGQLNFDAEVSNNGETLYVVDGRFDANGGPYEANLVLAKKENSQFFRAGNSADIFKNINTSDLEYAPSTSKNELEICFTRALAPLNINSQPKIFTASRNSVNEPFTNVKQISNLTGFVEASSYNADDSGIYFHKKDGNLYRLYFVEKAKN